MSPWIRLWMVFGAAVAAALFLKALPAPVVLVLFVGGVATVNMVLRGRARRERSALEPAGPEVPSGAPAPPGETDPAS